MAKENRKIILELVDPTGIVVIGERDGFVIDYYNESLDNFPEGEEPAKKFRYLLTIGEHQYWITREGKILEHLT